ncbi:hypothetical protein [Sinobaca sp. H24]|uniref:hypothetical protein n=1 Tax=Sinobaca sp. H24 TaxID=2923376 RepID=UPI00207AFE89|nr:hypothetical protein [Sinobaca sp. H24]
MRKTLAAALVGVFVLSACGPEEENSETSGETNEEEQEEQEEQEETTANENREQEQDESTNQETDDENNSESQENHNSTSDENTSEENEGAGNTEKEQQKAETEDTSSGDNEASEEDESTNENNQEGEIAKVEVSGIVFDYIEGHEDFDAEEVKLMVEDREEEENVYHAQVFTFGPEDAERQGTQTLRWYSIDKMSGEVKNETPGMEEENEENENETSETEITLSEIASMSPEERESHHRNLAADEEHVMDRVYDQLLLPGIHENTRSYEGRVGPEESIRFEFPNAENSTDRTIAEADVEEEGITG